MRKLQLFLTFYVIALPILFNYNSLAYANFTNSEEWEISVDSGSGYGQWTGKENSDGSFTVDGEWTYVYNGAEVYCPFSNGIGEVSGESFSFSATGTATISGVPAGYNTSAFTLNVSGTTANNFGNGDYSISFNQSHWPSTLSGDWYGDLISGGGTTTTTSDTDYRDSDVEAFVTRFYQQCLSREPDTDGLDNWVASLANGYQSGADLAESFIFSEEFQNRNTSDSEFVTILYNAFFDREPDTSGYNNWMDQLADDTSRASVLDGFTSAQEFITLCENYGITASSSSSSNDTPVQEFVTRFYQQCLSREPDTDGLDNWVASLANGYQSGADLAESFIFSEEFQNRNTSDSEFVTILYNAFFDREPDTSGYNNWMDQLADGTSRASVLDGFTSAQEFIILCENYGITPAFTESESSEYIDLAGSRYSVTEIRNLKNCGGPTSDYYYDNINIQQDGCSVTFFHSDGIASGNLSGTSATFTSTWYEDGGIVDAVYNFTFASDGSSFQGTGRGTWTDGYDSCQVTSTINGTRY